MCFVSFLLRLQEVPVHNHITGDVTSASWYLMDTVTTIKNLGGEGRGNKADWGGRLQRLGVNLDIHGTRLEQYKEKSARWDYRKRGLFSQARCNVISSNLLDGRFTGLPKEERHCICSTDSIESIEHTVLHCPVYNDLRNLFLKQYFSDFKIYSNYDLIRFLLDGTNQAITSSVVSFLEALLQQRRAILSSL